MFLNSKPVERNKVLPEMQASTLRSFFQALAAASMLTAAAPAAFAQVIVVPAPAPVQGYIPAPRAGQQWHHGNWEWAHNRFVWRQGGWAAQAPGPYSGYAYPGAPQRVSAPAPPPPAPRVERLSADALFAFDRADVSDIRPRGLADLAQVAARLRASSFGHVEVRGYTDRLGSDSSNLDLSIRRANAVKAELVRQGIPASKIRATGLGSQDPVTQCPSMGNASLVRCLRPDRRVEIVTYVRD